MPSGDVRPEAVLRSPLFSRPRRRWRRRIVIALVVVALIPAVLFGALKFGFFAPLLESEAVAAFERALPANLDARIGATNIEIEGFHGLGVALDGFALTDASTGEKVVTVKETRLGVSTMSALRGKPQVQRLSLSGVQLHLSGLDGGQDGPPRIASIEKRLAALFAASNRLFDQTMINGLAVNLNISDVTLQLADGTDGGVHISKATFVAKPGRRLIDADIEIGDQTAKLTGEIRRQSANSMSVTLNVAGVPLPIAEVRTMLSGVEADHLPGATPAPVLADITMTARRTPGDAPDELKMTVEPKDLSLKLGENDFIPYTGRLNFVWTPLTRVLSLRDSPVRIGRSSAVLSGGLRDAPADVAPTPGRNYQFELIANEGISNPIDSPARAVRFASRAQGYWSSQQKVAKFTHIELSSEAGRAEGAGTLDFGVKVPTAIFALDISDFALAGVKQFWPASVARQARHWVLDNLAGGRVTEGTFLISEPLRRRIAGTDKMLEGDSELSLAVEGVRFDVTGNIPPVRDADGRIAFKDGRTVITLDKGTAYLPSGRTAEASDGTLVIHPQESDGHVFADLDVKVQGQADALGELISFRPISAQRFREYHPEDLSGDVDARVKIRFLLNPNENDPPPEWSVALDVKNTSIATPFEGRMLSDLTGQVQIDAQRADINVSGKIDGVTADISMVQSFGSDGLHESRDIVLNLGDKDRLRVAPGLEDLVSGVTPIAVSAKGGDGEMSIGGDLSGAKLSLPWVGWTKGVGVQATTAFKLLQSDKETQISKFSLTGATFGAEGDITVAPDGLVRARFSKVRLNAGDDVSVRIDRKGPGYDISIKGKAFDARALIRHVRKEIASAATEAGVPVDLVAEIGKVTGFGDETLRDLKLTMHHDGRNLTMLKATAMSSTGFPVSVDMEGAGPLRKVNADSLDAGSVLRFLDIYGQVRGGILTLSLSGKGETGLAGRFDLRDFRIFNEPRLNALVSSGASNSASLNDVVRKQIDTREVKFDRASAELNLTPNSLEVDDAIIRGPDVGAKFRGTAYDKNNHMRLAGTFMPAYAVNSLLAGIPIIGLVLGNGSDKALIGVTFLLEGDADHPKITVNPLSAIAPGVFRSIFEFR